MESEMEWVQKAAEEIAAFVDNHYAEANIAAIIQRHASSTETAVKPHEREAMLNDLGQLLEALGWANTAMPISPHAVMLKCIEEVKRLRAVPAPPSRETETPRCSCRMSATMISTGITHTPEACYFNPQGLPVPAPPSRPAEPEREK